MCVIKEASLALWASVITISSAVFGCVKFVMKWWKSRRNVTTPHRIHRRVQRYEKLHPDGTYECKYIDSIEEYSGNFPAKESPTEDTKKGQT